MEAKLIINGVDFAPWCRAEGVQQDYVVRRSRQVVATDGTLYEKAIKKRHITVSLVELRDATARRLSAALAASPGQVTYTDAEHGDLVKTFIISEPKETAKTVTGGNTYWNGFTFSLEEQ